MKPPKQLYFLVCMVLFASFSACTNQRPVKECTTFSELPDPTDDVLSDWSKVTSGLHASFVSTDCKYAKSLAPEVQASNTYKLTGWKGERLSAQLLLWSAEDIEQVECEFEPFISSSSRLPSDIAQARFVRYVMTDIFEPGCGYRKPEDFPASLTADMLDHIECMDISAKTVRPVWVSIHIPESAAAGDYQGKLKIYARGQKTQTFTVQLEVQDKILPPPAAWAYHLDLWQHPSAVARAQNVALWSSEHFEAMRPLMKMLADAGQKVITATLNKDPWNNQCFDKYEDMIQWTKKTDGTWTYDYTIFDKWIDFMMELGVKKMINCYSIVPWNNEIHYKDQATDEMITIKADPGTKIFEEMWGTFLPDFVAHLKSKGWLEITNIAMDERSPKDMKETISLIQKTAPELGISLADNHKSYKEYPFIREISVAVDAKVDPEDIEYRREKGLITTYYVCCSDKFPNMFSFSEPAEAVYSAWYAVAADYDGFLRWAYNSWVENPLTDSRFRTWPAGDTYMVYPEARSTMRFERLVEGIQDAEKIRILRNELKNSPEKLGKLEKEITRFNTIEPAEPIGDMLNRAKSVINEISR